MDAACESTDSRSSQETKEKIVKCGYCIQSCDVTEDARTLPCGHIHCMACLQTNLAIRKVLQCPLPKCGKLFDVQLKSLAKYIGYKRYYACDACESERADVYCLMCRKKYCRKHLQSHQEILAEHKHIEMDEYRVEAGKLELRLCIIHTGQPYLRACKTCLTLMCVDCLCSPGQCIADVSHIMVEIDELALHVTQQIQGLLCRVANGEQRLAALLCLTSAAIDEHESETRQMLQNERLQASSTKHLVELRNKSKTEMQEFMGNIVEQQTKFSTCRLRCEARLKHSHKVDLIEAHAVVYSDIQLLVNKELPTLRFEDVRLSDEGDNQKGWDFISYDCTLDHTNGLTSSVQLPKFLNFIRSVRLASPPLSLCHYERNTYVGLQDGSVCRIDSEYRLHKGFLKYSDAVASIIAHKHKIYTLVYGNPMKIYISNLEGELIRSWDHTDTEQWSNKMTIFRDRLIVPDRTNSQLVVYALNGKKIKQIRCSELSQNWVGVCSVKVSNSIVISNYQTSLVFAVDLISGGERWKNRYTADPLGITSYGQNNLLVFNGSAREIEVLHRNTGWFKVL